ncbi:MAG: hypothetical protein GY936_11885 [Ignavibacteriae bacterium]|nr:hypothetical protein [Ignavibacteriota bacterium]
MKEKIILISLFLIESVIGQAKLQNENIERNKLKLRFNTSISYSVITKNNKNIFHVKNFQDESMPGDVKLPSNNIFISLPKVENPKFHYTVLSKQEIHAIPEFNEEVKLNKEKELVYSRAKEIKNSKTYHFNVKGYLWIEDNYCLHLEVIPAIFISSQNIIEVVDEFEIELIFEDELTSSNILKKSSIYKNIISNNNYSIKNINKFKMQSDDSWIDYTKQYLKIGTAKDGIYRVSKGKLEELNVNVSSVNPKTFRLLLRGEELPIYVEGESDFVFNNEDFIEFIGVRNMGGKHRELGGYDQPYNEYLGRYTDTTIYWLTWDGAEGKRVDVSNGNDITATDTLDYYSQVEHFEKNKWFDFSCASLVRRETPYWIENKTWNDGGIGIGIRNKPFTVSSLKLNKEVNAYVKLQDWGSNISSNAHHYALSINSNQDIYDSTYVNKYEKVVLHAQFSSDLLSEGANTLKLHSFATSATLNNSFFDWYEIEYPRYLIPNNEKLKFSFRFIESQIPKIVKLQDVSLGIFSLWQYGDIYKKYNLNNVNNEIIFSDTISSRSKFIYMDESKILNPTIYYTKQFTNLRSSENRADYIAITHKKFKTKVDNYSSFIEDNYELITRVVDIDDIYDEYSYGFFNPEAVKDFLKSTHNYWQFPKPQNIVLIGGATYDYYGNKHNNFGINRVLNYVPSFGASVSDNWFVNWDTTGAYIPQMNIGRIPVTTNEELDWYFEKHQSYVSQEFDDWNKRYLFFSSGSEKDENQLNLLRASNEFVIENYALVPPIGGKVDHFYKTLNPNSNFGLYTEEYFNNSISNGGVFISYIGHSGTQTWDNSIISQSQLVNTRGRYPLVSDFGCSTGRFGEPDVTSFSQLFTLEDDGQAIVYIGNSSLGFVSTSVAMPKYFYKKILSEGIHNVSEAHKQAKMEMLLNNGSTGVYELFSLTNSLIGDPIISLPIPTKSNFVVEEYGIQLNSNLLTDSQDSTEVTININNFGSVDIDTLLILTVHQFRTENDSNYIKVEVPNISASISTKLSIMNKAGTHNFKVIIDPEEEFDELSKDDNNAQVSFNVASSSIRPLLQYQFTNGQKKLIKLLNPTSLPSDENLVLEISKNKYFSNLQSTLIPFDTLLSNYSLEQNIDKQRYWGRTKLPDENNYATIFSFIPSNNKYFITDSISIDQVKFEKMNFSEDAISIDSTIIKFELLSAAFYDGNTVLIKKNGVNYTFDGTLRGHYITLFEDTTYQFVSSMLFDVPFGGQTVLDAYNMFLDTVSTKYLVMFSIKDDGAYHLTSELKSKIKNFGSIYIDSLENWSSWSLIGKKGAIAGSMPEAFALRGNGFVTIDTTISFLSEKGSILTTEIGHSGKWRELVINQEVPSNSEIRYTPIGLKDNGTLDTLAKLNFQDSVADLSHIDSKLYPKMKILAEFTASDDNQSPILKSLGVDYDMVPELATNYQVVSIEQDSVEQGEDANLSFYVYNVGESTADSFKVQVEIINPDNSREKIFEQLVDSLGAEKRKLFNVTYNTTNFSGELTFSISIDSENKIIELYEDNNFYTIPFYVKGDTTIPSMNITFDGNDIFEGEYISTTPKIKIELSEPSLVPITDTSSVSIFLNNNRVNYAGNENIISVSYSQSNPKVVVDYSPQLDDGEYELRVFGKDASGNVVDSSGIEKSFIVQSDAKIMEVYNYPNPFADETYFTFKLTQIPDEVKIRIFTIAGRLIKEIILSGTELNYDLNKIYWDGIDTDGDEIGNGVYIYKVIMDVDGEKQVETKKLAVVK